MKQKLLKIAKIVMLILPLVLLFTNKKINFEEVAKNFASVPFWIIPVSFMMLLLRIALQSFRFSILTKAYTNKLTFLKLFHADMKAKYYSIAVPSSVGQDIVRGTLIREHIDAEKILGISLLFRITGIVPLILLSFTGLTNLTVTNKLGIPIPIVYSGFFLFILFSIALFSEKLSRFFFERVLHVLPEKIHTFGQNCMASIHAFKKKRKLLFLNMFISLVTQILIVLFSSFILKALTGHFFFIESFFVFPIVEIISILFPFSFNGAGAREMQYYLLLPAMVTITPSQIPVFMSLSSIIYIINLFGIFFVITEKIIKKRSRKKYDE